MTTNKSSLQMAVIPEALIDEIVTDTVEELLQEAVENVVQAAIQEIKAEKISHLKRTFGALILGALLGYLAHP